MTHNNKNQFWEVTNDFEFVASFVPSRRYVEVNLMNYNLQINNGVIGKVLIKGTGPNFKDPVLVTLEAFDSKKQLIMCVSSQQRFTTEEWQLVTLEIPAPNVHSIKWTEQGQDAEYWQGNFGARFKGTSVSIKTAGGSLLDCFSIKKMTEKINTSFNECQGPKLWSKGKVISFEPWNSTRDGDQLPDFAIICDNTFDQTEVYDGTSSLKLQQTHIDLFHVKLSLRDFQIRLIFKGNLKLILKDQANCEIVSDEVTREVSNG